MSRALRRRGIVEGFYGPPWTHAERVAMLRFAGRVGLNEYLYAPKNDPYHRDRWREPYPDSELSELSELARVAEECGVRFVVAIAPALTMRFADPEEHEVLAAKARQVLDAGAPDVALLFDDVPLELADAADVAVFGDGGYGAGAAHGETCARFARDVLGHALEMCPTDYAGVAPSPYRAGLAARLPEDALVMWTGADIVVGSVTREDIDAAAAAFGRRLLLWDNYPVNDFDRSRLFLGPLQGRSTDVAGSALDGVLANPMVEAAPSQLPLAAIAEWAAEPERYDPDAAAERAIALIAGEDAERLAPLVKACSSWPPSAPQSPEIDALMSDALAGDEAARARLAAAGARLAAVDAAPGFLGDALRPWIDAATDAGRAIMLACEALDRADGGDRSALRAGLERAEGHFANVLRDVLPGFVRQVLGEHPEDNRPTHARIVLLSDGNPVPGDRDLLERLVAAGYDAVSSRAADDAEQADLVIVTPSTEQHAAAAIADRPVPILAWGRLKSLGLGTWSEVVLSRDRIDVVDPAHPLAAGREGSPVVYRGPARLTRARLVPDAEIVATVDGLPALAMVRAGSTLADGRTSPADRVVTFLAADGAAPWLLTTAARSLLQAAIHTLLPPGRRELQEQPT